ncbi:unnamed protein product [Mesocestoides corti]|uniref:1-acylglycerol-3-phosphate O-acyltransferase n=1 Tax=Mesocestoides corti TaxID=53468 RepID=A0A0R3U8L3_MESCO|nr:unnamed protein product [Mesocestoides corti]
MLLLSFLSNTILLWQSIARIIGMRHHVHGIGNRIRDRPCVLVVNHQSALDIPGTLSFLNSFSSYTPILIDRSNRDGSIHKLKDLAKIIQNEKVSVIIFPEGTRGDGKSGLLPFKKGAFHLAIEAQVRWTFLRLHLFVYLAPLPNFNTQIGVCDIFVLPSVSTSGLTASDANSLADRVRKDMSNVYLSSLSREFDEASS